MNLRDKKILVTGADGFIGSHLTEELVKRGYDVRAFVYYNSMNSWGWLDEGSSTLFSGLDVFAGDIRDPRGVELAMLDCDVVFHLAALISIPFSYHSPDSYVDTNVKGTLNVLNAAKRLNVDKLLITSTSEVYGTAQYAPIDEKHPLQGQSPYSATKIGADRLAESFFRSFDLPVTIARPFNTYGPRQSARAVIPTVITQLLSGENTLRLGSLTPTRDFNFVADTVNGFIALAESDRALGEEVNIATGVEHTIQDVANFLIASINPDAKIELDSERIRPDASEVFRLIGDSSKLKAISDWRPSYDLYSGLSATIDWFRAPENLARYKAWLYSL